MCFSWARGTASTDIGGLVLDGRARPSPPSYAPTEVAHFHFIVRNGDTYLRRNLARIAELGKFFESYKIFFVENDSTDRTREILKETMAAGIIPLTGTFLDLCIDHSLDLCHGIRKNCTSTQETSGQSAATCVQPFCGRPGHPDAKHHARYGLCQHR